MQKLFENLTQIFGDRAKFDDETLHKYSGDASAFRVMPQVVVVPNSVAEIKSLVQIVQKYKKSTNNISITVRSAGTDMTGGPLGESIICDITNLNKIKRIGADYVTLEPGAFYRDLEKQLDKKDLFLPSYPASKELCTVGGMIANNSGGEKTLQFGKTEDYVLELKVVLSDGEVYTIKPLTEQELQEKIKLKTFEGEFYAKLYDLITKNQEKILKAKPKVSKNSTGYLLWNIWDEDKKIFNIPQLFVGSQGTLGIIVEAKLRVVPTEKFSKMYVYYLYDLKNLAQITNAILKSGPTSIESYDDHTLKLALKFAPQLAKSIGKKQSIFKFIGSLKSDFWIITKNLGRLPKLVVMVEFSSNKEIEIANKVRVLEEKLKLFDLQGKLVTSEEAKSYWTIRRESFNLLRSKFTNKQSVPFIDDFIVEPDKLNDFLPRLQKIMDNYKQITYTIAGHIGEGNFHIIPLMDLTDAKQRKIIPELSAKVYDLVLEFGGSISAEHNDGLIRSHFLEQMYGKDIFTLFKKTKNIFDRKNIFNPNKKTDSDKKYAVSHIKKDNEHLV